MESIQVRIKSKYKPGNKYSNFNYLELMKIRGTRFVDRDFFDQRTVVLLSDDDVERGLLNNYQGYFYPTEWFEVVEDLSTNNDREENDGDLS